MNTTQPHDGRSTIAGFLGLLRERKIIQWTFAYLAAAIAALQLLQFLTETYHWPTVFLAAAPVVLGGVALVVIVLAWYHGAKGPQKLVWPEAAVLTVLLVVTGWSSTLVGRRHLARIADPASAAGKSIAVLPFRQLGGGDSVAYVATGIHEELLAQLAKFRDLKVTSRMSVMAYQNTNKPIQQIARELGVSALLDASVQHLPGRIRVQAQLIDAANDKNLWAKRYDRDVGTAAVADLFAIEAEVAQDIAQSLRLNLSPEIRAQLGRTPTANVGAYKWYLKGLVGYNRWSKAGLDTAIAAFEAAIAADSGFAAAHAALANAYLEKADMFGANSDYADKAFIATQTALSLDPQLAEAHISKGNLLWNRSNNFPHEAAHKEFIRALQLEPSNTYVHDRLALIYTHVGLLDRALAEAQQAVALDPLNIWARVRIGHVLTAQHRYQEAATQWEAVPEEIAPMLRAPMLAEAVLNTVTPQAARRVIEPFAQRSDDPWIHATLALVSASLNNPARARAEIAVAAVRIPQLAHGHHAAYTIGATYTLLGQRDSALTWLTYAARNGLPCYPAYAGDKILDRLKGDRGYEALLQSIKAETQRYDKAFGRTRDQT